MTFNQRLDVAIREMVASVDYKPSALIEMIARYGAVEACKRLINSPQPSDGFAKLYEAGRLDLSVEAISLETDWTPYFSGTELSRSRRRLEQVGYKIGTRTSDSRWSKEELGESLSAYIDMYRNQVQGLPFVKSKINEKLRQKALSTRSKSSVEFRMQNYSAVFDAFGIPHVNGYLPANNVGVNVFKEVVSLLEELKFFDTEFLPADPRRLPSEDQTFLLRSLAAPRGTVNPRRRLASVELISRNPSVRQYVLARAKGKCEQCGAAPFQTDEGKTFLEVHHLVPLANSGPDVVENAVAVCPNCHRELHFGANRKEKTDFLLERLRFSRGGA